MRQDIKTVILDTDPGIDDAMALWYLHSHARIDLIAITTVFGNADVATTTRNAHFLCNRFGINAPVFSGAESPLEKMRGESPRHVHGQDGLGDTGLTKDFRYVRTPGNAHQKIIELVRSRPHEISILAIGPLTNLARALQEDPAISQLVREVVVMGGAFAWHGRRGNVTPVAEANIHNDPHAADGVLQAPWPVTVVGLDVTSRCVLPAPQALALAQTGGEAGRFLWQISRRYEAIYREHDGLPGCCLHDASAAICLLEPELFTTAMGPVRVVTEGIAMGQTIQRPQDQRFPPNAWDHLPTQEVCVGVDPDAVVARYTECLR
jgi:purine nucleosidase